MGGLYTTFSTSQYYDKEEKPAVNTTAVSQSSFKKPHQFTVADKKTNQFDATAYGLTPTKRKSLYEEAQKVASTRTEYDHIDFKSMYRVGQMVSVQGMNGKIRTRKGRIVEIVNRDLMYVGMEDSHKDVNGNWLIDFVTSSDIIVRI